MSLQVAEPGSPSLEKAGAMPFEEKASFFARIWWVKYGNVKIEKDICFMGRRMPTRSRSFVVRWSLPLKDFVNAVLVKASSGKQRRDGDEDTDANDSLMGGIQSSTEFHWVPRLSYTKVISENKTSDAADRTVGLVHFCCVHSVPPTRQLEQLEHFCLDLRETLEDWLLVWEWCDDLIVKGVTTSSYYRIGKTQILEWILIKLIWLDGDGKVERHEFSFRRMPAGLISQIGGLSSGRFTQDMILWLPCMGDLWMHREISRRQNMRNALYVYIHNYIYTQWKEVKKSNFRQYVQMEKQR